MTTRACFGASALALLAALATAAPAAAQEPSVFQVDTCGLLPFCEGRPCPAGTHPVDFTSSMGVATCFCAPGASIALGAPATCCRGTMCFAGSTCVDVADTAASLCRTPDMLCLGGDAGSMPLSYDAVRACFVPPGTSTPQPYWREGDCDGDGRPNGAEASGGTDPCCDEVTDPAGCCLVAADEPLSCCALDPADPVGCCEDAGLDSVACCALDPDPIGCCFDADGTPATCCGGHDPAACCAEQAEPRSCCEAAGGTPAECCEVAADPLGCCLGTDTADEACCAQYGTATSPECMGIDAANVDAGLPTPDGGNAGLDGGTAGSDAGELGFGGGAGCRCAAGRPEAPTPLSLLGLLAIAIPAIRRRR